MDTLNLLWVRITGSVLLGASTAALGIVGVWLLAHKEVGHRRWLWHGVAFTLTRGMASFIWAWEIYHQTTRHGSVISLVSAVLGVSFAYHTLWVMKDLLATFCHSEQRDQQREKEAINKKQQLMNAQYETFEAERKSARMLYEVLHERRG